MSVSRFNRKSRERLLYTATALVILVILSICIWVIPHISKHPTPETSPEKALPALWVLMAIHLVILAGLIWEIWLSRRGRRLRKIGLIIPGIIMILMSMLLIDSAAAYLESQPEMFIMAIILFISACCDMMTGVITIMLPARLPDI